MDDNLESNYAEMLHHLSVAGSDDYLCAGMIDGIPIRKLFISNLAERTTFKDLRKCFSVYGNIEGCYVRRRQGRTNYAFVTFDKVEDAIEAMQDGSRQQIRLHNRDLRVMPADSWHQPDSIEHKMYNMGKASNKAKKKASNEQYAQKCLQNDTKNVSIHMLNDYCLRHIFIFLPIIDKFRVERVCKRWRIIGRHSWHMMKTLDLSPSTWGFLATHTINTAILRKVLLQCGRFLTEINLSDSIHNLNQSTLTIVGKLSHNLTSIDVTALTVNRSGIDTLATKCKNITKFNLGSSTYNCDNELKNLFKENQKLEYLSISRNIILGRSLLYLPVQTMRTIILDRCENIQDRALSTALEKLINLTHFTVKNCIGVAERTLEAISKHCKNLNVLEIDGQLPSAQTADMLYLVHLVNLQVFKVTHNSKITDEFLDNLVEKCQQLTCIDITGCKSVTDTGLAAIATLLKLEKLTINYVEDISDNGLQNMCNLKELECRSCPLITDEGMSSFIISSSQLQLLDLSGCVNITNITLEAAKNACNSRSNNVMLKMIVGGTSIISEEGTHEEHMKVSPLLQTVHVNLAQIDDDINNISVYNDMYDDDDNGSYFTEGSQDSWDLDFEFNDYEMCYGDYFSDSSNSS